MTAQTKKEKILELFEILKFEKAIREMREILRAVLTEEQQNIFDKFTDKMVEAIRTIFENRIDVKFSQAEIEELIAMQTSDLFTRFNEEDEEVSKIIAQEIEILIFQEEKELSMAPSLLDDILYRGENGDEGGDNDEND